MKTAVYFTVLIVLNLALLFYVEFIYQEYFENYPTDFARFSDMYFGTLVMFIMTVSFSYFAKLNYLRKFKEARKADEMKTAFLHNMSHELRTPLNSISGFSEIIISEDLTIEEMIKLARKINTSGNHLLELIENLFEITMIEQGDITIKKEDVEIEVFLKEVRVRKDQLFL